MPENKTIIAVTWDDLLSYGQTYECFTDLVHERVREHEGIDEEDDPEVFVTAYCFDSVANAGQLNLRVLWEQAEEETYRLTEKGRLVLVLMRTLNLEYDAASELADQIVKASGEVVGS